MGATEQSPLMTMYPPFCSNCTIDIDTLGWLPVALVESSPHSITKWLTPSTNTQLNAFQVPNKLCFLPYGNSDYEPYDWENDCLYHVDTERECPWKINELGYAPQHEV
jgi:hypothetical protein